MRPQHQTICPSASASVRSTAVLILTAPLSPSVSEKRERKSDDRTDRRTGSYTARVSSSFGRTCLAARLACHRLSVHPSLPPVARPRFRVSVRLIDRFERTPDGEIDRQERRPYGLAGRGRPFLFCSLASSLIGVVERKKFSAPHRKKHY